MPKVILLINNIYNIYRLTSKSFLIILFSLFISASLAGLFVSSAHAETLDYNVNVEPALNVTIPTDTISLVLNPTNKTFSSQELNISVDTNNPYGYRLTMSSTGTSLIHTEDSNYTIPTLPTLDGGYTDESFIADKWGYKQDSSNWNSYTSGVTLLESDAPVNNDNTNLSFGAKIDYAQAPGNYTLVLNFNAVAKVATNDLVINFAGEGVNSVKVCKIAGDCTGDNLVGTVSTSGSSVPGLEDGSTYYLYPVFNANYEFVSWEKTSDAGTISDTSILNPTFTMTDEPAAVTITGKTTEYAITLVKTNATAIVIDGTSYTGSSATLTYGNHTISGTYSSGYEFNSWSTSNSTNLAIASTSSASTTITVHGEATLTLNGKSSCTAISGYMQDFSPTSSTCESGTLIDKRDNESYKVGKLADGNWWLLDNLRLGYAGFASGVTYLNNTNTNTTKSIATGTFNGWKATSGFTVYNSPKIDVASADTTTTGYGSGSKKIGVYYNYCAATMQSYCYAADKGTGNASQDVCPKGWRMPTGGPSGEYQALCNAVKGSACSHPDASANALKLREALSTPLSGRISDVAGFQGSTGYFWSSTYKGSADMYILLVNSSGVYPQHAASRYFGLSVRCVLK